MGGRGGVFLWREGKRALIVEKGRKKRKSNGGKGGKGKKKKRKLFSDREEKRETSHPIE